MALSDDDTKLIAAIEAIAEVRQPLSIGQYADHGKAAAAIELICRVGGEDVRAALGDSAWKARLSCTTVDDLDTASLIANELYQANGPDGGGGKAWK